MKERVFIPYKDIDEKLICYVRIDCGHDCWGNFESYNQECIKIGDKKVKIWENWFLEINSKGEPVGVRTKHEVDWYNEDKLHFDKTGFRTPAEYEAYLRGKKENSSNERNRMGNKV